MKMLRRIFAALALMTLATVAAAGAKKAPAPARVGGEALVIIDTDLGNDIDDALAMALAYKAESRGRLKVLAIGCHKASPTAADYARVVSDFYGHPEVEVGMSPNPVKEFSDYVDYTSVAKDYIQGDADGVEGHGEAGVYEDPVKIYRRVLAKAKPHSINFVSLGFGTTLARLLESGPDEISKLSGRELVAKKAGILSIMAGSYGIRKRAEYNVANDIPAMKKVFETWPGIIVQNPFEIGAAIVYPGSEVEKNLGYKGAQPVAEAYRIYKAMPYDRPSWDILSVAYVLEPGLFTVSEPGKITVDGEGYTNFSPDGKGNCYVLSATIDQPQAIREFIVDNIRK